ncbi:MAG: molecular chaperone HtpG, partial [Chlamydiia bacterium]|nr:molecular chaperone HtpG [Chlamydiia bacterium]
EILEHYCSFLPYPVYLGEQRINSKEPLWMKAPSECTDSDYKEFFRHLYPMEPEPLFWVHLNVDYPFNLKGILYFPKLKRDFEMKKSTVRLFCNRVYVSDDCKDVIPEYLMVLRGVIDSPDIPLNVSRSYLQMDRTVRQLATHISKKVSDSLSSLYKSDRERFLACWEDVSPIIKLGAVQDDKFYDRVKELLIWKNTEGEWTNVQDYLERNKEKTKERVLYAADATHHQSILNVYKEKGIEVLLANSPIDPYVINSLESKISPASFKRIDAEIDEHLIDKEREKVILDDEGKTEASKLADLIKQKIGQESLEVEAKSLVTDGLPAFIVMDENQRRMRDYMMAVDPTGGAQGLFQNRKMVINTNSPLIQAIAKLDEKQPELAQEVASEVYELALLSHKEIHPDQIPAFVNRTQQIIEKLAAMAIK